MGDVGFLLVHGGGHDSRCWSRMTPHLAGPSLAVDLPGRGGHPARLDSLTIADFVDSVVEDLDSFRDAERVVLVGHSMAGVTIPGVAARRPDRVAHLAFISCFVPKEGGSIALEMPKPLQMISRLFSRRPVEKPMSPRMAKYMFCTGMDQEQVDFTTSILVSEARGIFAEPVSRADLPPANLIPRTFVKLLQDKSLRPKFQDRLIANLGDCDVKQLDSGHDAMISKPVELASILSGLTV